jgi:phage-related protein (TIGR01555 family)
MFKFIEKLRIKFNIKKNNNLYEKQLGNHVATEILNLERQLNISIDRETITPNLLLNNLGVACQEAMGLIHLAKVKESDKPKNTVTRNNSFIGYNTPSGQIGGLSNQYANIGNAMGIMGADSIAPPSYIYMTYWTTFYQTSSIANRLVSVLTEAMTSKWIKILSNDEANREKNIEKATKYIKKKQIFGLVVRAVRQQWMHGGCALYIDTKDINYSEPLDYSNLKNNFRRFAFVDQGLLVPVGFETTFDFSSMNFNQPNFWQIVFPNGAKSEPIHYSRFIFFIPEELPFYAKINQLWWANSLYVPIHDDINNAERAFKSSGQLIQQASVKFLKSDMKNKTRVPGAAQNMANKNALFQKAITQNGNAVLLDKDDEIEKLEVSNLKSQAEMNVTLVNKVTSLKGVPLTRFWGNPMQGFSSGDAEILQWEQSVEFLQSIYLSSSMDQLFECLNYIIFGKPDVIDYEFNKVQELSENQKADIGLKNAQRRALDIQNGLPVEIALKELSGEGLYKNLKYDDCDEYAKKFEENQQKINNKNLDPKDIKDDKSDNKKLTNQKKSNQPENLTQGLYK